MFTYPSSSNLRVLKITSNVNNYSVASQLGNPSYPVNILLIIESGVTVGSSTSANKSLNSGALHPSSQLKIINNGTIYGPGGEGGPGAVGGTDNPGNGVNGNAAIDTQVRLVIDNTNGTIFGGGGGGGGGSQGDGPGICGGGGGGGGRGSNNAAGGVGGTGGSGNGGNGTPGSVSASGSGGAAACTGSQPSGGGGGGGDWAVAGTDGQQSNLWNFGTSGAAGKAIELNSNTVIWLGGNNASQVKGAVS